jgi:hypothetical protein
MLFLLRPRQTSMPFGVPRNRPDQNYQNQELQQAYLSTRRVDPSVPTEAETRERDPIAYIRELAELHKSGVLTDAEFDAAKARALSQEHATSS